MTDMIKVHKYYYQKIIDERDEARDKNIQLSIEVRELRLFKVQSEFAPELFPGWWCEPNQVDCKINCMWIQPPNIDTLTTTWSCGKKGSI